MKKIIPLIALSALVLACGKKEGSNKKSEQSDSKSKTSVSGKALSSVQSLSTKGFVADRVFYKFDDASVQENHKADLKAQAAYIKEKLAEDANLEVIVEGNCDERGGVEYNMVLGQKRADSVKDFLIAQGVSSERIKAVSFGKERIIVAGTDAVAYLQNRVAITKIETK